MRTLRERLAAHDAGPAVGTLVRCVNPESPYFDMSGKVVGAGFYDHAIRDVVVEMTSTGHVLSFSVGDLAPVERAE